MKKEIIEKLYALITAATAFIVALAWNAAIQGVFNKYYGEGIIPLIIYAVVVTIIAVTLTIWLGRITESNSKKRR